MTDLDELLSSSYPPKGPEVIPASGPTRATLELPSLVEASDGIAEPPLNFSNDLLRSLGEESLYFFAKGILGYDWLDEAIHRPLCELLESYEVNRRLVIVLPRSWLKTTLCSIAYPIWRAVRSQGNIRILLVQNTYDNAVAKLSSVKKHWEENQLLRSLWPELIYTPQSVWKGDSLCLNRTSSFPESTFECGGTRTQFTSRHYDLIIEDDTVAPKLNEMGEENVIPVKEDIVQAIGFHSNCTHLQNDFERSQIMVVGTRWFEKDLISTIQRKEDEALPDERTYKFYVRSCLETDGKVDEHGSPTYPKRFGEKVLKELRKEIGPYMFSCLYLNKPVRSVDMLFQQDWFHYYDEPPGFLHIFTTVDIGGSEEDTKGDPDWSVVMSCGKSIRTGRIYVLDYWHEKATPQEIIQAIFDHVKRWKPLKVGVEAIGLQKILLPFIREKQVDEQTYFRLEPIKGYRKGAGKNARQIKGLQPFFAAHQILLRHWHTALVSEALAFPLGAHDDLIDTLAMQTEFWRAVREVEQSEDLEVPDEIDKIMAGFRRREPEAQGPRTLDLAEQVRPLFDSSQDRVELTSDDLWNLSHGRPLVGVN